MSFLSVRCRNSNKRAQHVHRIAATSPAVVTTPGFTAAPTAPHTITPATSASLQPTGLKVGLLS